MSDVADPLKAAVEGRLPVHLISIRHEARFAARLLEVGDDGVLVELGPGHPLGAWDMVSCSFSWGPRTYTFLAPVTESEDARVWLSRPREVVSAERRITPRHSIRLPIEVELLGAHPASRPSLVDLALTGMKVAVAAPPGIEVGERISAVLTHEGRRIELTAELRHQTGDGLGFFFPETVRKGRLAPPPALAALVEKLRRAAG